MDIIVLKNTIMMKSFGVPIALFNFNRPRMTRRVFDVIKQVKPRHLMLIADGPRSSKPDDIQLCSEVRSIFDEIDWDCEVLRNFSDTNMGSFKRNSSGLNWVFDTVEEAIILEDDCIPSLSFFPYCEELLGRYRHDPKIGVISGNNFGFPGAGGKEDSYYFSSYALTWGWASWRRVWKKVDLEMSWWKEETGENKLRKALPHKQEWLFWRNICQDIELSRINNAWDYQLLLTLLLHEKYSTFPKVNMVSNEGHGADATHCSHDLSRPFFDLNFPLQHPLEIRSNKRVNHALFHARLCPSFLTRAKKKVKNLLLSNYRQRQLKNRL